MNTPADFMLISKGFQLRGFSKSVHSKVTDSFIHCSVQSWPLSHFPAPSTAYTVYLTPYSTIHRACAKSLYRTHFRLSVLPITLQLCPDTQCPYILALGRTLSRFDLTCQGPDLLTMLHALPFITMQSSK